MSAIKEREKALMARASSRVQECVDVVNAHYDRLHAVPSLLFYRGSRVAGRAFPHLWKLELSLDFLERDEEQMLAQTVPHEMAHLVVDRQRDVKTKEPKPHGREWQAVMRDVFGLEPERCHNMDAAGIGRGPRLMRTHLYVCRCTTWSLSTTRHNRIRRGGSYSCPACGAALLESA